MIAKKISFASRQGIQPLRTLSTRVPSIKFIGKRSVNDKSKPFFDLAAETPVDQDVEAEVKRAVSPNCDVEV